MKKAIVGFAILLSTGVFAQQINDPNAEMREAKNFHSLRVSHDFDIYLVQSDEEVLTVSARDSRFVNQIKTEVRDGELHIWHDGGNIHSWNTRKMKLKIYISFKQLDKLDLSEGCQVYAVGDWKDNNLKKELSGSLR